MPTHYSRIIQFWQELKRRKVLHVITVYAASAFVILELVDILAPSLGLPDWTLNLVLLLLCVGFVIAVILSWIYDIQPEGGIVKTESAHGTPEKDIPESSSTWKIASFISFVVIVGLILLNIFNGKADARIDLSLANSIAVLPFHNLSGDSEQDYICMGLTDEIISQLYKVNSFEEVRSYTSVYNYREPGRNIPKIAEELKVNYILEGSFKRMGSQFKITAQLIDAQKDRHIWLRDYEFPYAEIMGIPGEIALQIAHQLNTYVTDEEQQRIEKISTSSQEAFEVYQTGRFYWNLRTEDGSLKSIDYFKQAIELDPEYGLAYAGLADAYYITASYGWMDWQEGIEMAMEQAFNALELDGNLAEAYTVLASIYDYAKWDWDEADINYQRALELSPNYSTLHQYYAEHLGILGRIEEARMHINRALELDPLSFIIHSVSAGIYYNQGHFTEALRELNICDEIEKGHFRNDRYRFLIHWQLGNEDEAYEGLKILMAKNPRYDLDTAQQIYQESGLKAVFQWKIESDIAEADNEINYYRLSVDLALAGRYEDALYWLEKAYEAYQTTTLKRDIAFIQLHDDPAFRSILQRMGLPVG